MPDDVGEISQSTSNDEDKAWLGSGRRKDGVVKDAVTRRAVVIHLERDGNVGTGSNLLLGMRGLLSVSSSKDLRRLEDLLERICIIVQAEWKSDL